MLVSLKLLQTLGAKQVTLMQHRLMNGELHLQHLPKEIPGQMSSRIKNSHKMNGVPQIKCKSPRNQPMPGGQFLLKHQPRMNGMQHLKFKAKQTTNGVLLMISQCKMYQQMIPGQMHNRPVMQIQEVAGELLFQIINRFKKVLQ